MRFLIRFIVLSLVLTSVVTKAQNRWQKIYHDDIDAPGEYILETYDHGYLLLGRHGANYPNYSWLIKTDINGDILWEKTIGDGMNPFVLLEMEQNNNGSIYFCGQYNNKDPQGNPIIIKLDSCGNKLWCKEIHIEDNHDFANCITACSDGGIAVTINYTGITSLVDRICLTKFQSNGYLSWTMCYNSSDSCLRAEDDYSLIVTPDNGFLISGFCYYEDPTHPNLYWPEPYYIKVDSLGNFEWETIALKEDPIQGGVAWHTILSPDSLYFYSSISHYYYKDNTSSPAILKMNMNGEIIDIYDLAFPDEYGKLFQSVFISDSILAGSAVWGADPESTPKAVIFDTLGTILDSAFLLDNDYLSYVRKTFDDKLLFFTELYEEEIEQFDSYLFKLNLNLFSDTIYNSYFQYDTLCPYPIASDTIPLDDCELIVGIEEEAENGGKGEEESEVFVLYPNPASLQINCRLSVVNCRLSVVGCRLSMFIYDMFGRRIEEIVVPDGQQETTIDVSTYSQGIYIALLMSQEGIIGRRKFVVRR